MKSLTDEQIDSLLKQPEKFRDHLLLRFAVGTGARVGEIHRLRAKDVSPEGTTINIERAKNQPEGRTVSVNSTVLQRMLRYHLQHKLPDEPLFESQKGNPMSVRQIQRMFTKYALQAGIPRDQSNIHILRYSYIRIMLKDVEDLNKQLGHKSFIGTAYYVDKE